MILDKVPLDYLLFPYNFFHNKGWLDEKPDDFEFLPDKLRERGIGVLTMKPFAGDFLAAPFTRVARQFTGPDGSPFSQAALRYILNAGIESEAVFVGMFTLDHVYENIGAFFNPAIAEHERKMLEKLRAVADKAALVWLPDHYQWLGQWAPRNADNTTA